MGRIIVVANQKGGVGKTTTAVNLAASLAAAEQRTLLVDGDPQANATSGIGVDREQIRETVYSVIIGEASAASAIINRVGLDNLDVMPASADLAGAEVELVDRTAREHMMRRALEEVRDQYDYILIDCPPSLGLITLNMLTAADSLLIPLQCEYYALEGLSQLLNTVHLVQQGVNPDLSIDGVLLTMYDARLNLSRQVAADAREYFGKAVFETVVPRNVRLAEAPSFGKPIILYDLVSVGAQAYLSVAEELLRRRRDADPQPATADGKLATESASSPLIDAESAASVARPRSATLPMEESDESAAAQSGAADFGVRTTTNDAYVGEAALGSDNDRELTEARGEEAQSDMESGK